MASTTKGTTVGIAGNQTLKRIPLGTTITYGTAPNTHTLSVFNAINKGKDCDVSDTFGNAGEWLNSKSRNRRLDVHFECKVVAADEAGVLAITSDPPDRLTIFTVAGSEDTQLNSTKWFVNSKPDVSYSPDNDAIMSFDGILRLDDQGVPLAVIALS